MNLSKLDRLSNDRSPWLQNLNKGTNSSEAHVTVYDRKKEESNLNGQEGFIQERQQKSRGFIGSLMSKLRAMGSKGDLIKNRELSPLHRSLNGTSAEKELLPFQAVAVFGLQSVKTGQSCSSIKKSVLLDTKVQIASH